MSSLSFTVALTHSLTRSWSAKLRTDLDFGRLGLGRTRCRWWGRSTRGWLGAVGIVSTRRPRTIRIVGAWDTGCGWRCRSILGRIRLACRLGLGLGFRCRRWRVYGFGLGFRLGLGWCLRFGWQWLGTASASWRDRQCVIDRLASTTNRNTTSTATCWHRWRAGSTGGCCYGSWRAGRSRRKATTATGSRSWRETSAAS